MQIFSNSRKTEKEGLSLHLLPNELQPSGHSRLSLHLVLLEQHRPDELVNVLALLQLIEFAFDAIVFCLLGLKLLA